MGRARVAVRRWSLPASLALAVAFGLFAAVFGPVTSSPASDARYRGELPAAGHLTLPKAAGSLRFAVMGDVGRGDRRQYETASEMARWHRTFPFDFVLMLGDNIYGVGTPEDYQLRFERPYQALIDEKVTFHAAIGNHDPPGIIAYPGFGMNGRRYYSFTRTLGAPWSRRRVLLLAIDTVALDALQLDWIRRELGQSDDDWKIAFYHHPLYTSGRYRLRARQTRVQLEPTFIRGGLDVGFNGHEHFYERIVPQQGVQYFTAGGGGALRPGDLRPSPVTATGFDRDTHFILAEIAGDTLHFQVISRTGETIDFGTIPREATPPPLLGP
jgi:hypothetical protein